VELLPLKAVNLPQRFEMRVFQPLIFTGILNTRLYGRFPLVGGESPVECKKYGMQK